MEFLNDVNMQHILRYVVTSGCVLSTMSWGLVLCRAIGKMRNSAKLAQLDIKGRELELYGRELNLSVAKVKEDERQTTRRLELEMQKKSAKLQRKADIIASVMKEVNAKRA